MNMKKIYKLYAMMAIAIIGFSNSTFGQEGEIGFAPGKGYKQVNFGIEARGNGIPIYAGMDFGVGEMITIGPRVNFRTFGSTDSRVFFGGESVTRQRSTFLTPSFRGDYHFSGHIQGLPPEFDIYAGLSLGFPLGFTSYSMEVNGEVMEEDSSSHSPSARIWIQVGARYFFTDKLGAHIEFISYGADASIGLSYRL